MTEKDKKARNEFPCCFGEMPFSEMMRNMATRQASGPCCPWSEMAAQMFPMCCRAQGAKEGAAKESDSEQENNGHPGAP